MTTISDLYTEAETRAQPHWASAFDLLAEYRLKGTYFDHMPEWLAADFSPMPDGNEHVEFLIARELRQDQRRFWRTAAVFWTEGGQRTPFMLVQNAGREGDDYQRRFITDIDLYVKAVRYLNGLLGATVEEATDPSYSDSELDHFYGEKPS